MTVYCDINFKTKKALKEAVADGKRVTIYELTPMGSRMPADGKVVISGPHYPAPHSWYAGAKAVKGVIQPGTVK